MDFSDAQSVVIVGGGQAGAQAAFSLRQGGFKQNIRILCDEPYVPYQRPPLSKAYLKGDFARDRLFLKPEGWYTQHNVDLSLQKRVVKIDRSSRSIHCEDGSRVPYDALILSTGSRPRQLPVTGSDLKHIYELRGIDDVELLRAVATPDKRILIVGAGYIGLEVAATASSLGLDVTVIEMADRVLERVTAPIMSSFFTETHEQHGVKILTNAKLDHFEGKDGEVCSAILADGSKIQCNFVLVGVGIIPNTELASEAGIACNNGILVDSTARTNDPRIFAAGDNTNRTLVHYGRRGRLESVHNAIEQGKQAASAILGQPNPAEDCPWFWSDQFDIKLQIAGLSQGYDEFIVRGDQTSGKFAVFYLRNNRLISTDAINSPGEFLVSKKLIISGVNVVSSELEDTSIPMKDILNRYAI